MSSLPQQPTENCPALQREAISDIFSSFAALFLHVLQPRCMASIATGLFPHYGTQAVVRSFGLQEITF